METKIINCTPHEINVVKEDGTILTIEASGIVPRCTQTEAHVASVNGIAVTKQVFGEVINLPEAQPETFLVVRLLVASSGKDHKDLLVPSPMIRGEDGRPCGCRGLSVID